MNLLEVNDLHLHIRQRRHLQPVLRGVSLRVEPGQVVGLVGESGAGKSMLAKTILGLLPAGATIHRGDILFQGENIAGLSARELQPLTGRQIALIPQNPMSSLNPVRRIGQQLAEGMQLYLGLDANSARERSLYLLDEVLITDPERVIKAYTHELSGGMRQRVLIAMAFSCNPDLIVADEPTTALDVTVQKRVLSLIRSLQQKNNTAVLFVTHDLGVVAKVCDHVTVLFDGRVLEQSEVSTLFAHPAHAYTRALLNATPRHDQPGKTIQPVPAALLQQLRRDTQLIDRDATR